jgi:uncharacterized membrane protein YbaN (DUF454 family)
MTHNAAAAQFGLKRIMLMLVGGVMLALGVLGAVLPLLPTTPFLLAALACFARSCPPLERWLINHKRLGPSLRDWRRYRAIPAKAKTIAVASMMLSYAIFLIASDSGPGLQLGLALILSCCSTFILSRPSRPRA